MLLGGSDSVARLPCAITHRTRARPRRKSQRRKTRQIVEFLCVIQHGMWWLSAQQFLAEK